MISLPSPPPPPLSSPLREETTSGHFWLHTTGCNLQACLSCQPFEGPSLPRPELWGLATKSKTNPLEQPRSRAQTSRQLWPAPVCCSMGSSSSACRHRLLEISWGQQVHFLLHMKCCKFTTVSTFLAFLGKHESAGLPFLPHCGAVGNSCYVSAQMLRFRGKRCDSCIHLLSQFVKHLSAFHPEVS